MQSRTVVAIVGGAVGGSLVTALLLSGPTTVVAQSQSLQGGRLVNRPATPRIKPIEPSQFTAEQRAALGGDGGNVNVRTTLYEPELAKRWGAWLGFMYNSDRRGDAAISLYDKELVILRVNWLCHDDWVWGRHYPRAIALGWTDEKIAKIPKGLAAPGWSEKERTMLQAIEELHRDFFVSDATWAKLNTFFNPRQVVDFVFTVGQYHLNAMFSNSVALPKEPKEPFLPASQ